MRDGNRPRPSPSRRLFLGAMMAYSTARQASVAQDTRGLRASGLAPQRPVEDAPDAQGFDPRIGVAQHPSAGTLRAEDEMKP